MVKYLALTRVGSGHRLTVRVGSGAPQEPSELFGAFGTIHETVRFLKIMRTFRNVAFSKVCTVV